MAIKYKKQLFIYLFYVFKGININLTEQLYTDMKQKIHHVRENVNESIALNVANVLKSIIHFF